MWVRSPLLGPLRGYLVARVRAMNSLTRVGRVLRVPLCTYVLRLPRSEYIWLDAGYAEQMLT